MTDRPLTDPKWWTDLTAEGERYAEQCDQAHAAELRWGLDTIDSLNRQELLRLLDWDPCKTNTDKLRRKVRLCWIRGKIPARYIWLGGRSL